MAVEYDPDNYVASIEIDSLSKGILLLKSMVGVDKISQPFSYMVDMVKNPGPDKVVDISSLVGKKAVIKLDPELDSGKDRYFHGYITEIRYTGISGPGLESFSALIVPWFWFLKKSSKCQIFKGLTVNQILETIFKSFKFASGCYELKDLSDHPPLEHCVQYQETDFAFASRLMEEFGISYYFEHEKSKHKMILLDSSGKRPKAPSCGFSELYYNELHSSSKPNTVSRWENQHQVVTDKFVQLDYNFAGKDKFPTILTYEQEGKGDAQGDFTKGSFERYIHEGIFIDDGVSDPHVKSNIKEFDDLAKVRINALQAEKDIIYTQSDCRGVHAGYEFKLKDYTADPEQNNKEYYVTSVNHQIRVGDYGSGGSYGGKRYVCTFTSIPKDVEYHPIRVTPKSRIYGPQTAIVVGDDDKKEKQIYTDKHGRVKIMFHWDRESDRSEIDENSEKKAEVDKNPQNLSCWVRVAQGWAGNKWGSFFLPRVGQEVVVEFLDGDPDRPIVTGSVYNGKNLVPYKLPDHKTMSSIKSENVGTDGKKAKKASFNEIRFEDEEESEQLFIHAAKAMDTQVLGDHREYVGCNMQLTIDGNSDNKEKSDDTAIGNRDVLIKEGNDQLTLAKGNLIQKLGGGHLLEITEHGSINIGGALNIQVKGKIVISSADAIHVKSDKSIVTEAKESISFKAGKDITLDAKGAINLNSGDEILGKGSSGIGLTGGKSTIDISSDVGIKGGSKVAIKGSKVDINGAPPKNPASPAAAESPEAPTIQSPDDLNKAKVSEALKEKEKMDGGKAKEKIEFGDLG